MKKIKPLFCLCLFASILFANNYTEGDALNVVAFNGLSLRSDANSTSEKLGTIPVKEKVIILNIFEFKIYQDTIEDFVGNWVFVNSSVGEGYVFDAYLSQFPVLKMETIVENGPDSELSTQILSDYALAALRKENCDFTYSAGTDGECSYSMKFTRFEHKHMLIHHFYDGGSQEELELYGTRSSEVYYLVMHLFRQIEDWENEPDEALLKNPKMMTRNKCVLTLDGSCIILVYRKSEDKVTVFFNFPCC